MKIFIYSMVSITMHFHRNKSQDIQETSLWFVLVFPTLYFNFLLVYPILQLTFPSFAESLGSDKINSVCFALANMIFIYLIFFHRDRWKRVYLKVKEIPVEKRNNQVQIMLFVLTAFAIASIYIQMELM